MTYHLGLHSRTELRGVNPLLVSIVKHAIKITEQDFMVFDGLRTLEEQYEYVARGVSKTLQSKHLKQPDGTGHAVDLVPFIAGKPRWEEAACIPIARAMRVAAEKLGAKILWGGCWSRLDGDSRSPGLMIEEYVAKRRRLGRKPFVDAPHYELA